MPPRVLEPEVMATETEARDYDAMGHAAVNRVFVADFLAFVPDPGDPILDVGSGPARIPIELCQCVPTVRVVALDASAAMLALAQENVAAAGLTGRVITALTDARSVPFPDGYFAAVISNSIAHHLADPAPVFAEMVRVCRRGGPIFVRDLLRPEAEVELHRLVELHAAGASSGQRQMFADSLRASFTPEEVRELVGRFGFPPDTVRVTSDRHWTWAAIR